MANNGCGEDFYVSHAVIKQNFRGSTRDVTGKMAPFKKASVSNLERLLKMDFWEKKNSTFGILDIFTKHLCEKKMYVFGDLHALLLFSRILL